MTGWCVLYFVWSKAGIHDAEVVVGYGRLWDEAGMRGLWIQIWETKVVMEGCG